MCVNADPPPVRDHLIPECEIELWAGGAPQNPA